MQALEISRTTSRTFFYGASGAVSDGSKAAASLSALIRGLLNSKPNYVLSKSQHNQ